MSSPPSPASPAVRSVAVATCLAVAASVVVGLVADPVHATKRPIRRHTYELGTGTRLITVRDPDAPNEVRIVRVNHGARSRPVLEVLTASDHYPGYRQPSLLGKAAGSITAINGDFVARDGRPKHLSMVNGEVWTSGIQRGPVFAVSADGHHAFMGRPRLEITARSGAVTFPIGSWNAGDPRGIEVAGFTWRGGSVESPSGDRSPEPRDPRYCAARLIPAGSGRTDADADTHAAARQRYSIQTQPEPCLKTPVSLAGDRDAVVITGLQGSPGGNAVERLEVGDAVSISTRLRGWPGVADVMGGSPLLVKDGRNVAPRFHPGASYLFNFNPRTAVGLADGCLDRSVDTDCITYTATVDGRQSERWSKGMRMPQLATALIRAGATWALNLDGGGGTVMWVRPERRAYCEDRLASGGCLVTRPSERGRERGTSVALAVRLRA